MEQKFSDRIQNILFMVDTGSLTRHRALDMLEEIEYEVTTSDHSEDVAWLMRQIQNMEYFVEA